MSRVCSDLEKLIIENDIIFLYGLHDSIEEPPMELLARYFVYDNWPSKSSSQHDIVIGIEGMYALKDLTYSDNQRIVETYVDHYYKDSVISSDIRKIIHDYNHIVKPESMLKVNDKKLEEDVLKFYAGLGKDSPNLDLICNHLKKQLNNSNKKVGFEIHCIDSKQTGFNLNLEEKDFLNYINTETIITNRPKYNKQCLIKLYHKEYNETRKTLLRCQKKLKGFKITEEKIRVSAINSLARHKEFAIDRLLQNKKIANNIYDVWDSAGRKKTIIPFGYMHMFDLRFPGIGCFTKSIHNYLSEINRNLKIAVVMCTHYSKHSKIYRFSKKRESVISVLQSFESGLQQVCKDEPFEFVNIKRFLNMPYRFARVRQNEKEYNRRYKKKVIKAFRDA